MTVSVTQHRWAAGELQVSRRWLQDDEATLWPVTPPNMSPSQSHRCHPHPPPPDTNSPTEVRFNLHQARVQLHYGSVWRWHLHGTVRFAPQQTTNTSRTSNELREIKVYITRWGGDVQARSTRGKLIELLSTFFPLDIKRFGGGGVFVKVASNNIRVSVFTSLE